MVTIVVLIQKIGEDSMAGKCCRYVLPNQELRSVIRTYQLPLGWRISREVVIEHWLRGATIDLSETVQATCHTHWHVTTAATIGTLSVHRASVSYG